MTRTNKSRAPALTYLRTSSAVNVGTDKDRMRLQLFDKGSAHAWRRFRSTVIGHLLRFQDLGLKMKNHSAVKRVGHVETVRNPE